MELGFAVKVLGREDMPSQDTRRWQSGPHLRVSIGYLHELFGYLGEADIRMYRMGSNLAPYETHPDLPQFRGQVEACGEELAALGERARALGLRLSTHPGQYTVLNSEDPKVQAQAVAELSWHAALMDAMGLGPEAVVILHVGSAMPSPAQAMDRFVRGFEMLPAHARRRLVVENDDRTFALGDVLLLAERIGRPVVWDILHHHCNDPAGIPDREALQLALGTWPEGVRPKIHFSTPKTAVEEKRKKVGRRVVRSLVMPQLRAHADVIDPIAFEQFVVETATGLPDFDVMLEAKAKDLALLRLRAQLAERGVDLRGTRVGTAPPVAAPAAA